MHLIKLKFLETRLLSRVDFSPAVITQTWNSALIMQPFSAIHSGIFLCITCPVNGALPQSIAMKFQNSFTTGICPDDS